MTLVVPFDGSELAKAALVRATEFGRVFDEPVLAVSVIPNEDVRYAREHDWIEPDQQFDMESIVSKLHEQVMELCPSADFRHVVVDRYAPSGSIATRLRKVARDEEASMVFIGSENAGHIVTGVSSVGETVAADGSYDVVIVRQRVPSTVEKLNKASPHQKPKSDFYLPD